jgi:hypothetical protein
MFQIGKTVVSKVIFDQAFCCDLSKCKGACCIEGDAGAPLMPNEVKILRDIQPKIRPYLRSEGISVLESQGHFVIDEDEEYTTPLVDKKECAYVIFESGVAKCGIEKAYEAGAINWPKPISCHLYPIRTKDFVEFTALNYETWNICSAACDLGSSLKVPVFRFLKDPLTRAFGSKFFQELERVNEELKNQNSID